jgi:hypothetical protein
VFDRSARLLLVHNGLALEQFLVQLAVKAVGLAGQFPSICIVREYLVADKYALHPRRDVFLSRCTSSPLT